MGAVSAPKPVGWPAAISSQKGLAPRGDKSRRDHPRSLQAIYKVVIDCSLVGGQQTHPPAHEVLEVDWFDSADLPPLSTGRITESQILRIVQLHQDQTLPADFD